MQRRRAIQWFIAVFLVFAIPAGIAATTMDRFELHRVMHPFHSAGWDRFFRWGTHLADGLVPTALALLLLLYKDLRSFLLLGLGAGLSAIVTQSLKRGPFADEDRPSMFKESLGDLHWVLDLELHHHNSFPSGHATAAVSMCLALAILIGRPQWGAVLAFVAVVLAYSRVYLSQHFTADIVAGGAIGLVVTLGVYHVLYKSRFSEKPWLDRRLWRVQNQ
jgi:membrane-associated phospholipid phosphatase